jgi:hypothetical protein
MHALVPLFAVQPQDLVKKINFFIFIYYGLHYLANKYYWENKNYTS